MDFIPGKDYERPCAVVQTDDGRKYAIPVFDHVHSDPQFGFPHEHYHIDGRFYMEPRMYHEYRLEDGCTNAVIKTRDNVPIFLEIEYRVVACIRTTTGLTFPGNPNERQQENLANYELWYSNYIGKSCKGKRCPHYGTEMLEKDGRLICPLHHLIADADTLKIIPNGRKLEIL